MSMPYQLLLEQEQQEQRAPQQQHQHHQQLPTNWLEHGQIAQSTATSLQQNNICCDNFLVSPISCIDQHRQQHHQHQQSYDLFQNSDFQQLTSSEQHDEVQQFLGQYGDGDGDGLHIPPSVPFASDHVSRQIQHKMPLTFDDGNSLTELFAGPSTSQGAQRAHVAFFAGLAGMEPNNYVRHIETQALELQDESLSTNSNKLVLSDPEEFPTLSENMHKKKKFKSRQLQKQQQLTNQIEEKKCQFFFETEPSSSGQMQQQQALKQPEDEQQDQQFDFTELNAVNDVSDQGFSSSNQSTPQQLNDEDTIEQSEHYPTYFTNNRRYYYATESKAAARFQQQQPQQTSQQQQQQQQQPHWNEYSQRRTFYNKQNPNYNYTNINNQFEPQYYQRPNGYYKNGSYYHQHPFRKYRQQQQQQQQPPHQPQQQSQHEYQQRSHEYYGYYPRNQYRSPQQPQQYLQPGIQTEQMESSPTHFVQQQDHQNALYSEKSIGQTLSQPLPPTPTADSDNHNHIIASIQQRHRQNGESPSHPDDMHIGQPANVIPQQPKLQYSDFFKGPFNSDIVTKAKRLKIEHPKPKQTAAQWENSMSTTTQQTLQLPEAFSKGMLSCLSPVGGSELSNEAMRLQYLMKQANNATKYHSLPPPPPLPTELFRFLTQNDAPTTTAAATTTPVQNALQRHSPHKPKPTPLSMQYCTPNKAQHPNAVKDALTTSLTPQSQLTQQQQQQPQQNFVRRPAAVANNPQDSTTQNLMWHAVSNFTPQNRLKTAVQPLNQQQQQHQPLKTQQEQQKKTATPPIYPQQARSAHWRTIINAEDVNTFLNTYEQRRQQQEKQQFQFKHQILLQQQQPTPPTTPPLLQESVQRQTATPSSTSPESPTPRPQLEFRPEENIVANIPTTMLSDQYGMAGLYAAIKRAETNQSFAEMVFGIDLESLGVSSYTSTSDNNNTFTNCKSISPQPVLPHFIGPLADDELPNMQYKRFSSPTPSSNEAQAGSFSGSFNGSFTDSVSTSNDISLSCCYGYPLSDLVRQSLTPPNMVILSDEQLFLVFYTQVGDLAQLLSAEELYNREWAYYLMERAWIKHFREFSYVRYDEHYERGYYMYFDASNWCLFSRYMKVDLDQIDRRPQIPREYRE